MLTFNAPKTKILIEEPEITRKSSALPNPEYAEPTAITKTRRSTPVCSPEKLLPRLPGPHAKSKKVNQINKTLSVVGENYFNGAENYSNAGENNSAVRGKNSAADKKSVSVSENHSAVDKTSVNVSEKHSDASEKYSDVSENHSEVSEKYSEVSENHSGVNTKNSRPVFYSWEAGAESPTFENPVNCFQIRDSRVELPIFPVFREYE